VAVSLLQGLLLGGALGRLRVGVWRCLLVSCAGFGGAYRVLLVFGWAVDPLLSESGFFPVEFDD
jgi:hypothetical protein